MTIIGCAGCPWVQRLQEEMASFPYGESDDMHDAEIWGLQRTRRSSLRIATDEEGKERRPRPAT
jgi:hypothetical protein